MPLTDLTDPAAVTQALDEFDQLGKDAFLDKYGYKPAKSYFVERDGKLYDSKAIAGVAFGYQFPSLGPLRSNEFSGGEATVKRTLEDLGFSLSTSTSPEAEPSLSALIEEALSLLETRSTAQPNLDKHLHRLKKLIEEAIPTALHSFVPTPGTAFSIRGSGGLGNAADVPWVGLFSEQFGNSPQEGYYLVYLFAKDGSAAYLSLNQGTENVRDSEHVLRKRAVDLRRAAGEQESLLNVIDLRSTNARPRKYERGNAYAVRYEKGAVPDDETLAHDLAHMTRLFDKVQKSGLVFHGNTEPVHLLLKWSATTEPRTIDLHREVAEAKGAVWWGAFGSRDRARVSAQNVTEIQNQLASGVATHGYLYRNGECWRTSLQAITANPAEVDEERLPSYYSKEKCNFFVLLSDFVRIDPSWPLSNVVLRNNPDPNQTAGAFGNQTTPLLVFELFDPSMHPLPDRSAEPESPRDPLPVAPSYPLSALAADTGIEEQELARWVRAIERKGQAILYGPPGTGKTYVAERLARHLIGGGSGFSEFVQFHPAYAYEDFVMGIRPDANDGMLSYSLQAGRFVAFCDQARTRDGTCVLIIDEINRANLSQVFGELMYLLEYRAQEIALAGGRTFTVPRNVRVIGTMNTADRSIALMDYALRRRFAFLRLDPNYDLLARYLTDVGFASEGLVAILKQVNTVVGDPNYALGISFFVRPDLAETLEDVWRMEIEPYLEEYFFDDTDRILRSISLMTRIASSRTDGTRSRVGCSRDLTANR